MQKLEVYLSSGHTIYVECESCEFKFDKPTGKFFSYMFNGIKYPKKLGIAPTEIVGYVVK